MEKSHREYEPPCPPNSACFDQTFPDMEHDALHYLNQGIPVRGYQVTEERVYADHIYPISTSSSGLAATEEDIYTASPERQAVSIETPRYASDAAPARQVISRSSQSQLRTQPPREITARPAEFVSEIFLDQDLWEQQPNTSFEIPFGKSIILKANNIQRYLVLDEGFIRVEQVDKDTLIITSTRRGSVLMHIWDDTGRWTFQFVGVIPPPTLLNKNVLQEDEWVKYNDHWTFTYTNNWNSFYVGDSMSNLTQRNLNFVQNLSLDGPTPYGDVYGFVNYFKFDQSIERTGQGLGLVGGDIGPLEDFSVYGYDTSKRFSELSLPGRFFRGIRWDQSVFDKKVAYSFIYGKDRSNFRVISPGITSRQESFITGAKMTLFPDSANNYSINFVRGFGEERPDELKPKVWSAQVNRQIQKWQLESELAHDEEDWAMFVRSEYDEGPHHWNISARNYEDNFATITNFPGDRGEAGAIVSYDWLPKDHQQRFYANLDVYRDRDTFNPFHRKRLNYDLATGYNYNFNRKTSANTGIFYTDTPQLISPRQDFRVNTTLSHSFRSIYERALSTYFTTSYQRSRFDLTPTAEYDRYSVTAGVRFPIIPNLNFYSNYEYSWVDVIATGEKSNPRVLSAGLSYSKKLTDQISTRTSMTWRDEQEAENTFSFLAGTDTFRGNFSMTYRPKEDMEIFLDTTVRNVIAESNRSGSFHDADIRLGVRTTWDLMFGWDPTADITGYVYQDLNQNGMYDEGEPGVEHVVVRVGDTYVSTDFYGRYFTSVKAKEVKVAIDLETLPKGYNIMTETSQKVKIQKGELNLVDFGLVTRTRISGSVFVDKNQNGRYDAGENRIPRVILKLDKDTRVASDFDGYYQFSDVPPGMHIVEIDISSIPLDFIPTVKLKQSVVVEEGGSYTINVPLRFK